MKHSSAQKNNSHSHIVLFVRTIWTYALEESVSLGCQLRKHQQERSLLEAYSHVRTCSSKPVYIVSNTCYNIGLATKWTVLHFQLMILFLHLQTLTRLFVCGIWKHSWIWPFFKDMAKMWMDVAFLEMEYLHQHPWIDKTVRLWDVNAQQRHTALNGHTAHSHCTSQYEAYQFDHYHPRVKKAVLQLPASISCLCAKFFDLKLSLQWYVHIVWC